MKRIELRIFAVKKMMRDDEKCRKDKFLIGVKHLIATNAVAILVHGTDLAVVDPSNRGEATQT